MKKIFREEHWIYMMVLMVASCIFFFGIGWGLPDIKRQKILIGDDHLSQEEIALFENLRDLTPARIKNMSSHEVKIMGYRHFTVASSAVDEGNVLGHLSRINPKKFDFDPDIYHYGTSYLYPMGAIIFALKSLGILHVTKDTIYYTQHPSNIAFMYTIGRMLNIIAVLGTLIVLNKLGNMLAGRLAGVLAMLAYLFSTAVLNNTLVSKPHVYAAFWGILGVYLLVTYKANNRKIYIVLSALAIGLAMGASLPAGSLSIFFPIILYDRKSIWGSLTKVVTAWIVIGFAFLLSNPYIVFNFEKYRNFMIIKGASGPQGYSYAVFSLNKLKSFLLEAFTKAYSFPVSLFGIIGLIAAIFRGKDYAKRMAIGTSFLLLSVGGFINVTRIFLFLGPFICLFSAYSLTNLVEHYSKFNNKLCWGLLIVIFLPGLFFTALFARDVIWDDAWYKPTLAWIQNGQLGRKTTFGIQYSLSPVHTPPFPFLKSASVRKLTEISNINELPDYVIIGNYRIDARKQWDMHSFRGEYQLVYNLGYRPSYDWFLNWRMRSQSRIAAWVYKLKYSS